MGEVSGSFKLQWHGKSYFSGSDSRWLNPPALQGPRLYATIDYRMTRDSDTSSVVHCQLSGHIWKLYSSGLSYNQQDPTTGNYGPNSQSGWPAFYGYDIEIYASINGNERLLASKGNSPNTWTSDIYGDTSYFDIDWASNDSILISFRVHGGCHESSTNCAAGSASYNIEWVPVPYYNPYIAPTGPTSCYLNKNRLKPDQDITVSWSGETGGTVGINHFQLEMSQWRGGSQISSYRRVSGPIYYSTGGQNPCSWTINLMNTYDYDTGQIVKIRPGDVIRLHVACYSGPNYEGWFATADANYNGGLDVQVYKDGLIQYKQGNTNRECTKVYYKQGNTIRRPRYARVKSSSATRIIDIFTSLYE